MNRTANGAQNGLSRNTLSLREAQAVSPAPTGAATEWVSKIGDAMREAVSADDIATIMKSVVEKAKAGDEKAIRTVLDFVGRAEQVQRPTKPQLVVGVRGQSVDGHFQDSRRGRGGIVIDADQVGRTDNELDTHCVSRDCAEVLGARGPMPLVDLAAAAGYEADQVDEILATRGPGHPGVLPLFDKDSHGYWRLTAVGRKELLNT